MAYVLGNATAMSYMPAAVYVPIVALTSVDSPKMGRNKIESKRLDIPFITRYPGMIDPGTLSFSYEYELAQFNTLQALFNAIPSAAVKNFKVTLANGDNFIVMGFLAEHNMSNSQNDNIKMVECQLQIVTLLTAVVAGV